MKIKKGVITAAGRSQHTLPLHNLIDRDGQQKTALRIILEEAASSGVDQIALVICPGDEAGYRSAAGDWSGTLTFIHQNEPLGYGHALLCARDFVGEEPFLHLVGDHLYLSSETKRCAQLLVELAGREECSISAVQATRESNLPLYGAIGGRGLPNQPHLYQVECVLEKPTPTVAEQHLIVPGLRAGHYLCFFGMHVLTPLVMELLQESAEKSPHTARYLSPTLAELARRETYLACELPGRRYNIGVKFGFLYAQLAFALAGRDRDEVLTQLVELLATRSSDG